MRFTLITALLGGFFSLLSSPCSANTSQDTTHIQALLDSTWAVMYRNPDSAISYCEEALALSRAKQYPRWEGKSLNRMGVVFWVKAEFETALTWLEEAHAIFAEIGDTIGMGSVANNFGITYMSLDYYELAMRSFQEAIPGVKAKNSPMRLSTLYNNLGMVSHAIRDYDEAIDYFEAAFDLVVSLPDPKDTAMLHNNIGLTLRDYKLYDRAEYHHRLSLNGYSTQDNLRGVIEAQYNYGGLFALIGEFVMADSLYQDDLVKARTYGNKYFLGVVWLKIAELRIREGRYQESIEAGDSTFLYLSPSHGMRAQQAIFEAMSKAHEGVGQYQEAFDYSQKMISLSDSILNEEKVRSISELTLKYETELKDKEIENLRQQETLGRWQKGGLSVIILLVLVIAFIVFLRQRAIIRREKALQEKSREASEAREALGRAELKAANLEKQRLEEDVKYKSKEISNLAIGIFRHHDLLQNLDKSLQSIRKKVNPEVKDEVQELTVMVVSQLGAEKERQDLQLYIEEAEQGFFQILDSRFPQLTERERRLCALIRMGYSSKEIAAIFNINPNSVDMGRYRLRKKLDPDMQITLNEFLGDLIK